MCRELDALRQSIADYSQAFDARSLTPDQAADVVRTCSRIKASVSAVESMAAAVMAEGESYKAEGHRGPDHQLGRQTGMSPAQARRALATGRRMINQPDVAAAALSGDLSPEQAAAVSAGVEANPSKAQELLEMAGEMSLGELHEAVAKVKADSVDLERRRRAIHEARRLNRFTDLEGVYHANLTGNPEDGMTIAQVITEIRRRLSINRRQLGIANQTMATLDYDAMMTLFNLAYGKGSEIGIDELLEAGLFPQLHQSPRAAAVPSEPLPLPDEDPPAPPAGGPANKKHPGRPTQVIVRVDYDTLLRGYPREGEVCDAPGFGPVPVSLIHDLMGCGATRLAVALTKGRELRGVYLDRRHPNEYQKAALDFLYPVCAVKGCNTRAGMQADHREDWHKTHYTVLDLLDYLCWHHHNLKTRQGWGLVAGQGKRDFVPPTDRRHPRFAPGAGRPPPGHSPEAA